MYHVLYNVRMYKNHTILFHPFDFTLQCRCDYDDGMTIVVIAHVQRIAISVFDLDGQFVVLDVWPHHAAHHHERHVQWRQAAHRHDVQRPTKQCRSNARRHEISTFTHRHTDVERAVQVEVNQVCDCAVYVDGECLGFVFHTVLQSERLGRGKECCRCCCC